MRGRVLKARAQPTAECHFASEVASHASIDRLYDMVFGRRDLQIGHADPAEIEQREDHTDNSSPVACLDEDIVKGQMLADGLWSDAAIEIVWASPRHRGTKESVTPYHWMILQNARVNMVPPSGSMFDLSPGESSEYVDNYFSCCKL